MESQSSQSKGKDPVEDPKGGKVQSAREFAAGASYAANAAYDAAYANYIATHNSVYHISRYESED